MYEENRIASRVIQKAIEVHKELGPGLLESAYEECLYYELINDEFRVDRQIPLPVVYKDLKLKHGYRADLIVNNQVIVEVKSIDTIADIHIAQTLTYLKFSKLRLGIILNFNVCLLKTGIRRIIL